MNYILDFKSKALIIPIKPEINTINVNEASTFHRPKTIVT